MANISTKNKLFSVLLAIIMVVSVAGGIYANIMTVQQKEEYTTQIAIVNKYEQRWSDVEETNAIVTTLKEIQKAKADEAQKNADTAKSLMKKYGIFCAVLFFVAVMMLICIIVILTSKKSPKKEKISNDNDDNSDNETKEIESDNNNDINSIIDNFNIEAPKPSINKEDE
jgi:preprotein translocase subunit SecG